jgi:hypothetical protein
MQIRIQLFTLMQIRIRLFTLLQIRIQPFTLMRIRVRPFALMQTRIRIRLLLIKELRNCNNWLKTLQCSAVSLLGSIVSHISSQMSLHGSIVSSTAPSGLKREWIRLITLVRIRIQIQLPKMMQNHADPDSHALLVYSHFFEVSNRCRIQIAVHV